MVVCLASGKMATQSPPHHSRLSVSEDPEVLRGQPHARPCVARHKWRIQNRLVGEPKRAPVNAEHCGVPWQTVVAVQRAEGADRLVGVQVHGVHEPPRLICADGDRADIEWAEALAYASEFWVHSRVTRIEEPPRRVRDRETAPECPVAIERGASAEMSRRRTADARVSNRHLVPQVQLREDRKSTRLNSSHIVISYAVFYLEKQ